MFHAFAFDQPEGNVLPNSERIEERGSLEQHAELGQYAIPRAAPHADDFLAIDLYAAFVGPQKPEDTFQQD